MKLLVQFLFSIVLSLPLFSGTLGPCYSRRLRDQVLLPHRNGRKISFIYLNLCVCKCETELSGLNGSNNLQNPGFP
jgi:hypothetical protein